MQFSILEASADVDKEHFDLIFRPPVDLGEYFDRDALSDLEQVIHHHHPTDLLLVAFCPGVRWHRELLLDDVDKTDLLHPLFEIDRRKRILAYFPDTCEIFSKAAAGKGP